MFSRNAILLALGFCLLGLVGGAFGALVAPVSYQAEAFVVVYGMPSGLNNLISHDEANTINAYYAAGALQDSVIARVQQYDSQLTASDIRSAVTVSIVAYTPLTRVTAAAPSPDAAANLANLVALCWVRDASSVITTAYTSTYNALTNRETQLTAQINTLTGELAPLDPKSAKAVALNEQLQGVQTQLTQADNQLSELTREQYAIQGNAWVSVKANASDATRSPDIGKAVESGGAVGLALGIVCLLWFARASTRLNVDIPGKPLLENIGRQRVTSAPILMGRPTAGPARTTSGPASAPPAESPRVAPPASQSRPVTQPRTDAITYDN